MVVLVTAAQLAFWILAPITVAGALGMVLAKKPVHSALSLAGMMVALGCLYASLQAPFLFVAQIIVYTGAVMMLFLFTMMIIGVDSIDSLVETIKGQRIAAVLLVVGFCALIGLAVGNGIVTEPIGLDSADTNVPQIAKLIFGPYIFAFEATAALLITAALAAIVLAHGERLKSNESQKERALRRVQEFMNDGISPAPKPGPGIYARHNSIEYPGLLPDGSVEPTSVSPTLNVRGLAVVENDGLRAIHAEALQQFHRPHDELAGTNRAAEVASELADPAGPKRSAIGAEEGDQ